MTEKNNINPEHVVNVHISKELQLLLEGLENFYPDHPLVSELWELVPCTVEEVKNFMTSLKNMSDEELNNVRHFLPLGMTAFKIASILVDRGHK